MRVLTASTLSLPREGEGRVRVERRRLPCNHEPDEPARHLHTQAPPPHPTLSPARGRGYASE